MSEPGKSKNYFESSGSSMFIYFLLKASRLGYIDKTTYVPVATKAYEYASDTWVTEESDGTLGWEGTVVVGSLDGNGTFEVGLFLVIGLLEWLIYLFRDSIISRSLRIRTICMYFINSARYIC